MRPRVFPAEDTLACVSAICTPVVASMRPRVFPAEDGRSHRCPTVRCSRFNEAAGIPRGRPGRPDRRRRTRTRFNEAAGIPRGRRRVRHEPQPRDERFNEAAGIPRGRLPPPAVAAALPDASMRPRVFPAEDLYRPEPRHDPRPDASMRPRVFPAEDPDCGNGACGRHRASMRPRVFPAEDCVIRVRQHSGGYASMRPRVFPAEDMILIQEE